MAFHKDGKPPRPYKQGGKPFSDAPHGTPNHAKPSRPYNRDAHRSSPEAPREPRWFDQARPGGQYPTRDAYMEAAPRPRQGAPRPRPPVQDERRDTSRSAPRAPYNPFHKPFVLQDARMLGNTERPAAKPVRSAPPNRPARQPVERLPARSPTPQPIAPETPPVEQENLLAGRNPIREALRAGRDLEKLMVAKGDLSGSAREIVALARERSVPLQEVDRAVLDRLSPNHQGLIAYASAYRYATVEDIFARAAERGEEPLLVILDGLTDPHNLGAIIRSAECAGAHGVIVPERRAVGLTVAAVKASAGAVEHLPVARVGNLTRLIQSLRDKGLWILAAHTSGELYTKVDLTGPVALVIGSEGEGVSRLVLETCDKRVALPIRGRTESLNASVAAGILLYEVMRRRGV